MNSPFLSRYRGALQVTLATLVLCAAYSFLSFAAPSPSSPDEASNLYFARVFAASGMLWTLEPLQIAVPEIVHPRSVKIVDDLTVPGGFLGLPVLYGALGMLFGRGAIPFLTPVIAVLGVAAWFGLIATLFGRRVGLVAAALLAFHPVWWYAAERAMFPTILFAALAIASAWLVVATPVAAAITRRNIQARLLHRIDPVLAGILLGLALAVRPAELHWIAFIALVIAVPALRRPAGRRDVAHFIVAAAFVVGPFLYLNHVLYGSVFASGYGQSLSVPTGESMQGFGNRLLGPLRPYLFPLGFAPRVALHSAWLYGIRFFWWWSALVAAGLFAWRKAAVGAPAHWKKFGLVAAAVSLWLVAYYGSWTVQDNPDPNAVTIGSSYLRYWLPIFVFSTVPVALLFERASRRFGDLDARHALSAAVTLFALVSGWIVFTAPGEGLLALRATHQRYQGVVREILEIVPEKALIIADRADKYFLGERSVLSPLRADSTYAALPELVGQTEVYYFGITFPDVDLAYLRTTILAPKGLEIEIVRTFDHETLYRIIKK